MRCPMVASVFGLLLLAMFTASATYATPAVYDGTDWTRLSSVTVTSGSDSVPYVDLGELGLPGGSDFGTSLAIWTDGDATLLVVGAPTEDSSKGAAYIFRRDHAGAPWHQEVRIQANGAAINDQFGQAVAVMSDLVVVSAPSHDNGSSRGAVYTFTRDPVSGTWLQEYVELQIPSTSDFGYRIALADNWLVVGAPVSGAVGLAQTYHRDAAGWTTGPALVPPDLPVSARFGSAIALSGNRALVGAPYDSTLQDEQGSAYLFEYDAASSNWTSKRKLVDSGGHIQDHFGSSVALFGDSAVIAGPGFVVSFRYIRPTRDWAQQAGRLQGEPGDHFGSSLAYDGSLLAVGKPAGYGGVNLYSGTAASWIPLAQFSGDQNMAENLGSSIAIDGNEVFSGAPSASWGGVYSSLHGRVATFAVVAGQWNPTESIHASDDNFKYFGDVVAASGNTAIVTTDRAPDIAIVYARDSAGQWQWEASLPINGITTTNVAIDGDTLIIGAPAEDFGSHYGQGAAYIYVRTRNSSGVTWTQQAFLVNVAGNRFDYMGAFVSLSGDTALVGVPGLNGDIGGAYVFVRSGTSWTQQATLTASETLASKARVGVLGAIDRDTALLSSGDGSAVYVFQRTGTKWAEHKKIPAPTTANDCFGCSIALSDGLAFIGAPFRADTHSKQGGVYVFDILSGMQRAFIEAPDLADYAEFGYSVAAEANRLIIGAKGLSTAYAYTRREGNWTSQAKFIDSESSQLGSSVSVSKGMVLLGAPYAGQHSGGRAYVFQDDRIFEDELE